MLNQKLVWLYMNIPTFFHRYNLALVSVTLLLASCATNTNNIPLDYRLNSNKGVVVVSLTSSGDCGYAFFVDIRRIDKSSTISLGMQDLFQERDWQRPTGECRLDDEH